MLNPKLFEIPSKETYKLDNILEAARLLHQPQFGRRTILIAGTNGKGSTCAYLTSLFISAGLRVGTYSSPHVLFREERIRLQGKPIEKADLEALEFQYEKILAPLTYFERMTLLSFLVFREQKVDLQILEVGIGGRLDATNISDPDLSVITTIDYDHQDVLGNSLTEIAFEKAGIMRSLRPCFSADQKQEAEKALTSAAKATACRWQLASALRFEPEIEQEVDLIEQERGKHQAMNARLALAAFKEAARLWNLTDVPEKNWKNVLHAHLWPARIQILREQPLFLVDGAHNPSALAALRDFLILRKETEPFTVYFGMMKDKSAQDTFKILLPFVKNIRFPLFYPERQMEPQSLAEVLKLNSPRIESEMVTDLEMSLEKAWNSKERVLVVGSFYLAGECLRIFDRMGKRQWN